MHAPDREVWMGQLVPIRVAKMLYMVLGGPCCD